MFIFLKKKNVLAEVPGNCWVLDASVPFADIVKYDNVVQFPVKLKMILFHFICPTTMSTFQKYHGVPDWYGLPVL